MKKSKEKKMFKLEALVLLEASDIDDAFKNLSKHFKGLSEGEEGLEMFEGTEIKLGPVCSDEYKTLLKDTE